MNNGRKHAARARRRRRWLRVAVFALAGLVVLGGGAAFAAYRYEESQAGRILPGVTIGGVQVGEMTRAEAIRAVSEVAESKLSREIVVEARGETWHVTPQELGAGADVGAKVDVALDLGGQLPWHRRVINRIFDRPLDEALQLEISREGDGMGRFLKVVRRAVRVNPKDAAIALEDGELVLEKPKVGRKLHATAAANELERAVLQNLPAVELPVEKVKPKVSARELGYTIVVRISENKLYVYRGVKVKKVFDVATGTAGYPTPRGTWNIWDKRANPTWINPAPDGWGKDLPASIGPGPGNPLGTHALYLDAPGIRIHGTYAGYSIGTYASHGCIRMHIEDSKELFSMIPVGTKVHIV